MLFPLTVNLDVDLPDDDNAAMDLIADRLKQYGNMAAFTIDLRVEGEVMGTVDEIIQALTRRDAKGREFLAEQRRRSATQEA